MHHSKLLKILRTLTKEEFIQFRKILQSPFFVSADMPLKLYDSIRKYFPAFDSPKLAKAKIFAKVFPNRDYDDNRMRALMHHFTDLLEQYLVWKDLNMKKLDYQKRLTQCYSERQLFELYKKERRQILHKLDTQSFRDIDYYEHLFELHHEYYYHPQRQKFDPKDNTLLHLMQAIDQRFMLSKLRVGIEMRNHERIFQRSYDLEFLAPVLEKTALSENKILKLFGILFKLFEEDRVEVFEKLEILFFNHLEELPRQDAYLIYLYALNYVNRKVNEGKAEFSPKAFHWYRFGLKDELLIQNGKITEVSFNNIVVFGCREREFNWVTFFMNTYKDRVISKNAEDVWQFNKGLRHFYKGELDEAFTVLNQFDFHHSFQLKVRMTSLLILFEQFLANDSFFEAVISYGNAFLKFISRADLFSRKGVIPVKNTVEIVKKLTSKIYNYESKTDIKNWLNQKLEEKKNIAGKARLIEIVKKLK